MNSKRSRYITLSLVSCALCLGCDGALAQSYPSHPIRWVIPFAPGGPSDIIGRFFAAKLTEAMGQQVIIDNRGGASGIIACDIVAHSAPDGYTVMQAGTSAMTVNQYLHAKLPYNAERDFRAVSELVATPNILVVHPGVPARSVKELVELAKGKPGQITFASGGAGTANHLSSELFKYVARLDLVHVPFKGTGPALTAVLAGQVQMMFSNMLPAMPQVRAGKLRGLAVTSAQRSQAAPDVPTVAESGYPGFEASSWHGVVVPAATPAPIVKRLHAELKRIADDPAVKERFAADGTQVIGSTPEEFAAVVKRDSAKWARIIKAAGIKAE